MLFINKYIGLYPKLDGKLTATISVWKWHFQVNIIPTFGLLHSIQQGAITRSSKSVGMASRHWNNGVARVFPPYLLRWVITISFRNRDNELPEVTIIYWIRCIWRNIQKFVERRKSTFSFKYSFCCAVSSSYQGGGTTSPFPQLHSCCRIRCFKSRMLASCLTHFSFQVVPNEKKLLPWGGPLMSA